jgi:hypothetical protein
VDVKSGRAFQGSGERAHYEAEFLQDHGVEPIPGGNTVPKERTGLAVDGSIGV